MRKITREKVMKMLYIMDVYRQISKQKDLSNFLKTDIALELYEQQRNFLLNKKDDVVYFDATFNGIIEHLPQIDEKIQTHAKKNWTINQFGYVERSLLRVAVYELYWSDQEGLSPLIIVSSVLDLGELFIDEKSIKFIHGVLGAIIDNIPTKDISKPKYDTYKKVDINKTTNNKAKLAEFKKAKKAAKIIADKQSPLITEK